MARKKHHNRFDRKGQFFRTYREIFESDAYRSLTCIERGLLLELQAHYLPSRCDIFLSTRDAADRLNVHPDTAGRAFYALESRGFIKLRKGALWQQRISREWRLTFESYRNREPTDEWRQFRASDAEPNPRGSLTQKKVHNPMRWLVEVDE